MIEIVFYERRVSLNEISKKMGAVLGYDVTYLYSFRACRDPIHKAFKLVDWLSKPYQPMADVLRIPKTKIRRGYYTW
jgi:hypothetical protein